MPINFIDLFAGAGGLSEGFVRAGYTPLAHIEMDKNACDTLRTRAAYHWLKNHNQLDIYKEYLLTKKEKEDGQWLWSRVPDEVWKTVIQCEIGDETILPLFDRVDELVGNRPVDLVVGGPPCQAYSVVGRARMGDAVELDPRNELYKYYVRFLDKYNPKMFVFENVLGILSAKKGEPFRDLQCLVKELGYSMNWKVQTASEHGVLQTRHRVIIVGWKTEDDNHNPTNYHYPELEKEENHYQVLKDLFSDLPKRKSGEGNFCEAVGYTKDLSEMKYLQESDIRDTFNFTTQHVARPNNANDREIYKIAIDLWRKEGKRLNYSKLPERLQHHKNKETFLNRFQVVDPDGYCHTVVAHIAMDGHYYIYPNEHPTIGNSRSITVREAARLQSFPDDYFFEGSRTAAFKQIGNAVPVVLAYKIALEIKKML